MKELIIIKIQTMKLSIMQWEKMLELYPEKKAFCSIVTNTINSTKIKLHTYITLLAFYDTTGIAKGEE